MAKQDQVERIKRAVRSAERQTATGQQIGGTGQTVIKKRLAPIPSLIEAGKIGAEELRAADEILASFAALAGALWVNPQTYERVDCGGSGKSNDMAVMALGVARYQRWANIWSVRAKLTADPMLAVVIAAVVDERPFSVIADDVGWTGRRYKQLKRGVVCGLQDYAARAGWVTGNLADKWMHDAERAFDRSVAAA